VLSLGGAITGVPQRRHAVRSLLDLRAALPVGRVARRPRRERRTGPLTAEW
jgi:hypothetical protein